MSCALYRQNGHDQVANPGGVANALPNGDGGGLPAIETEVYWVANSEKGGNGMKRIQVAIGVLSVMVCRGLLAQEPRIEVDAEATTSVRPDQAEVSLTITALENDSEKALAEMKGRAEAARAVIVKFTIKDSQIRRSEAEISANLADGGRGRFGKEGYYAKAGKEGYYAKVRLSFILMKLAEYEELAAKLAQLDGVEISKPSYGRADADQLQKDTLKKALANAQGKGKFIADALGVKLGSPIYACERVSYYAQRRQDRGLNTTLNQGNVLFSSEDEQTSAQSAEGTDRLDNVVFESRVTVHFKVEK